MASLDQSRQAIDDGTLRQRLITAAYAKGIDNPEQWVNAKIGKLVGQALPTHASGQAIADVRAYGASERDKQEKARAAHLDKAPKVTDASDPTYITDDMLLEAVDRVAGTATP